MRRLALAAALLIGCAGGGGGGTGGRGGSGPGGPGGEAGEGGAGGRGGSAGRDAGAIGGARAEAGPPPVDAPPDTGLAIAPQVCEAFAAQYCQRMMACSSLYTVALFGDLAVCQERALIECRTEAALPGSGLGRASIEACQAALPGAACDDFFADRIPACQLKGTLATDAPCGSHGQCASGYCRMPETSFCGKCAARAAEGATCDTDESCQFPLLCSEAGKCVTAAGEGDLCNESRPCRPGGGLFCAADNSCKRRSAANAPCNSTASAPRQPCEIGHSCRPTSNGLCRPYQFVASGASCGVRGGSQPIVLCRASGSCVEDRCRPAGLDGEACTIAPLGDSGGCMPPALCLEGRCKLPDPASCM